MVGELRRALCVVDLPYAIEHGALPGLDAGRPQRLSQGSNRPVVPQITTT